MSERRTYRKGGRRNQGDNRRKRNYPEFIGRVQMTKEGYAFIIIDNEEDDVFVRASKTRGALNGDIVKVAVVKDKTDRNRKEGEVVQIVERSKKPFVGILHIVKDQAWVLIQNRFMPYDISIPIIIDEGQRFKKKSGVEDIKDKGTLTPVAWNGVFEVNGIEIYNEDGERGLLKARSGMKVAAVVDSWERYEPSPVGRIVDVLGEPGENDTEMHAILAEYSLPYRFEPEVESAADEISDKITTKDIKERRDFRDVLTITIDPVDAKDFDDAISFRKLENKNIEVGVHIADVTHYVTEGSVVDKEAVERATSVYLVDRTVPMLPEKLSNKLCSLRPNEEKLTFSAVFELTPLGKLVGQWFGRTIIRSDYRFAYENAQAVIDAGAKAMKTEIKGGYDGAGSEKSINVIPAEMKQAVLDLNSLASKLRKKRFAAGAISFERPEMKVEVDEKGRPVKVYQKVTKEANWLVEEFMLLANKAVAEFVAKGCRTEADKKRKMAEKTFVYRIHDEPNLDKLENLRTFIGNFGYKLGPTENKKQISKELNSLFAEAKGTPEYSAIELLSLRTMAKARYGTDNLGHYGLAFDYYTHFTSPIRRYPDMMVHRLLAKYLAGGDSASKEEYDKLCKYSSEREIVATEAERASIKYKLVEFMQDKVGFEFDGHISGLTDWGIYVEIEPTKIEGMVALRDVKSDFYEFDADHYRICGRETGKIYNLGDSIKVRVKKTNLEHKLLDYELVETSLDERLDYESNRDRAYVHGYDGTCDHVAVGKNKVARKEKVRQAIKESKRKLSKKLAKKS